MKITTVRYRKLVTGPGYSHQAVEAEAVVEKGEKPEDALLELGTWVRCQLGENSVLTTDPETLRGEIQFLSNQRQQLRSAITAAEAEKRKLRDEIVALEVRRENAGGEPAIPF